MIKKVIMKYTLLKVLILSLMIVSCCSSRVSHIDNTNIHKQEKKTKQYSTKPYDIVVVSNPQKRKFNLNERKNMDMTIVNYGVRDFLVPEWFDVSYGKGSELYIEIFKIANNQFEEYESTIYKNIHSVNPEERKINTIKNGGTLSFKNLEMDKFKQIQHLGKYYAKIHIDLSDYGYFKKLESDVFFEVVSDSIKIKPDKNTDLEEDEIYLKLYSKKSKNTVTPKKDSIN